MRTAIYIRVSTEEQAKEGYSISGQLKKLKAFCVSQGWIVEGVYADEGISAKDMKRPQLQQLLKDIKTGDVECVLVYRLDRLTRSVLDLYKMLEIFENHDCKFKSATEVYDTTTAMGRMFITIVAALAQWERENMGERISFGYIEKARQGKYTHNIDPFGYTLDKDEYKLYINEDEAKIVRLIYKLYETKGSNAVAIYLNERNILTKQGNEWSDSAVMRIINSHIYYGSFKWLDEVVDNAHEPIITKEEWDNAQAIRTNRRGQSPRSATSHYLFSCKLTCENCKGNMTGNFVTHKLANGKSKRYYHYRCKNRINRKCDKPNTISEIALEKAFIDLIENQEYKNFISNAAKKTEKLVNKEEIIDRGKLKKDLAKIEDRKKKWQYAWTEEMISDEDFKNRMNEARIEEDEIKKELSLAHDSPKKISTNNIISSLNNIIDNWNELDREQKKNLIDSFIDHIEISRHKRDIYIDNITFKHI